MTDMEPQVEKRLREELDKLELTINEEKTRIVDFHKGEPFDFLGYTFRWVKQQKNPKKKMILCRPQRKKRTRFLQELSAAMRKRLHRPVEVVVKQLVNPRVRGWSTTSDGETPRSTWVS